MVMNVLFCLCMSFALALLVLWVCFWASFLVYLGLFSIGDYSFHDRFSIPWMIAMKRVYRCIIVVDMCWEDCFVVFLLFVFMYLFMEAFVGSWTMVSCYEFGIFMV